MRVGIVGAGYVGLTTAVCLATGGHDVVCADLDPDRVSALSRGQMPFVEPQLPALLRRAVASERLQFVVGADAAVTDREIVFLCVATPQGPDGSHDLTHLRAAVTSIAGRLEPDAVVVTKSTVPVGTAAMIRELIGRDDVHVAANPEFLSEGTAVHDFLHPQRLIIGCDDHDAAWRVAALYREVPAPIVVTDTASAELVKLATNSFLATKLSFVNTISRLCEQVGADLDDVSRAIGLDARIGSRYLDAGPGWGGSCLPKDTRALVHTAARHGVDFGIITAAIDANEAQLDHAARRILEVAGTPTPVVAVWGLTFKAATDDLRDSPAIDILHRLITAGAEVRAYDPTVTEARSPLPEQVTVCTDAVDATAGADVLAVLTEWEEFGWTDAAEVSRVMTGRAVVDTRRVLVAVDWAEAGFQVHRIGG